MLKTKSNKPILWHLCSNRWNSALAEYALSTAKSLALAGYPTVFSPLAESIAEFRGKQYGLDTMPFSQFGLSSVFFMRKQFNAIKPRFIFVYGGEENFLTKFVDLSNCHVIRIKGLDQDIHKNSYLSFFGYKHSAAIVVPGEKLKGYIHPEFKKPIEKISLGCDLSTFHCVPQNSRDWRVDRPEIMILGRLDPIKGHRRFFSIMRLVLDKWDSKDNLAKPFLHVVGLPANLSEIDLVQMAEAENLGIDSDVKFSLKRIPTIAKNLSACALGVIPSNGSEVICRVAEEFLLCGTPILVSGVGSLEEVLFSNAGASYKGLNDEDTADLVITWLKRSLHESQDDKTKRSEAAQNLFSYATMARNFEEKILNPLMTEK